MPNGSWFCPSRLFSVATGIVRVFFCFLRRSCFFCAGASITCGSETSERWHPRADFPKASLVLASGLCSTRHVAVEGRAKIDGHRTSLGSGRAK